MWERGVRRAVHDTQTLFQEYAATPRAPELGLSVRASARKAWLGALATFGGAMLLGVPLSFLRSRRSRPWEPMDMLIGGLILAVFSVPIAATVVVMLQRYVTLFRTGRMVRGVVIEARAGGAVLQVETGVGPDRTFIPQLRAAPGQVYPVLIGDVLSSLALVVVARGELRRGSLLTVQQLAQVAGA